MTIEDPLPAPQPMDTPATRPPLDLPRLIQMVNAIQTFLAKERMKRDANDRDNQFPKRT